MSGDMLQCRNCRRSLKITNEWIHNTRDKCYKSKNLVAFVSVKYPINALPIEILSKVRCGVCGGLGAEITQPDIASSIELYQLSQEEFSRLAGRSFVDLSGSQIITVYNQKDNFSMSPEHRQLLEEKYIKAHEAVTRSVIYGFVEYAATDGQY